MLSIVIPIYNQDVRPLVYTLMKQCNKLDIMYQILCFDDCSDQKYRDLNNELAHKIHVNYTEMTENLGRSRIRNWLGKAAYYDYVLFLDGDSAVKSRDFIKNYVKLLPFDGVICGGRDYAPGKPRSKKKLLHWKYGRKRESLPAKKRNKDPWLNFHSNNFMIPEKIFRENLFDEKVTGYGYEDLLYAHRLAEKGIRIWHTDNPVRHEGIESTTEFLKKNRHATENLAKLYHDKKIPPTRLINTYLKLKNWGMVMWFEKMYGKYEQRINQNLVSENPSVTLFNVWKLHLFIENITKLNSNKNVKK